MFVQHLAQVGTVLLAAAILNVIHNNVLPETDSLCGLEQIT